MHQDLGGAGDDVVVEFADLVVAKAFVELTGTGIEGRDAEEDVACFGEELFGVGDEGGADGASTEFRGDGDGGDIGRASESAGV